MNDYFEAFDKGPLSDRGVDAVAPEIYRGIYAMPAFVTIPTDDLAASADFWVRGLGFIELFGIPGQLVHLRRWAFQDVMLVAAAPGSTTAEAPAMSVSFSCVMSQLDEVARACESLRPGSATGPRDTAWLTRDVEVITPEHARVIFTAAREYDPQSAEARSLADAGIPVPGTQDRGDNVIHD